MQVKTRIVRSYQKEGNGNIHMNCLRNSEQVCEFTSEIIHPMITCPTAAGVHTECPDNVTKKKNRKLKALTPRMAGSSGT